jgi:hypothetical protein
MTIVLPPSDPVAADAIAQVEGRWPKQSVYDIHEVRAHLLPGSRTFYINTHCEEPGHGPCLWLKHCEYYPPTGRWLVLDTPGDLLHISVGEGRAYLEGLSEHVERDMDVPRSVFSWLMGNYIKSEEVKRGIATPA